MLTWNGPWAELSDDPLLLEVWRYVQGRRNGEGHFVLPANTVVSQGGCPQPAQASVAQFVRHHPRIDIMLWLLQAALVDWQALF